MKNTLFLIIAILCPIFLIAQDSVYFRATKWEEQIKEYYSEDQKAFPKPGSILFIGSSTIRMWNDIDNYFPDHSVVNRGFGGAWISDLLYHMPRLVLSYKPGQIVLYAGANDISNGISPEKVLDDIKCFIRMVDIHLPGVNVIFLSFRTSPSTINKVHEHTWINKKVEEYCNGHPNVIFLDVSSMMYDHNGKLREELYLEDKLHITHEAYHMMAEKLKPLFIRNEGVNIK